MGLLQRAEVVEFSDVLNFFDIPVQLSGYLEGLGYQWKLVSCDAREAPRRSGMGYRTVTIDELPEELHPVILAEFENPARHYGEIRRGDTRLVIRSQQLAEQWERIERQKAIGAMGKTNLAVEAMAENAQRIDRGISIRPNFPSDHSHVMGGKAASASSSVRGDKALLNKLKAAAEE